MAYERRVQRYCETTVVIVSEIVQRMCSTDCKTFRETIVQMSGTFLDVFTGEPKYIDFARELFGNFIELTWICHGFMHD